MRDIPRRRRPFVVCAAAVILAATTAPAAVQDAPALIVESAAPAGAAGFTTGDRLVTYDGVPLPSPAALQAAEENSLNQDAVAIRVERGDSTLTLMMPRGRLGLQVRPILPPAALTPYEQGRAALQAQNTDDAIAAWTVAARVAQEAGERAASAWLLGLVGTQHEGRRQWAQASAVYTAAWELVRNGGDPAAQSRTLVALGRSSQNATDFAAARRWYAQAEEVDSAAGREAWAAGDLNSLGVIARTTGDLAAALDYYQRALRIRQQLAPDSASVAATLNNLGTVAYDRGDLAAARDYHTQAFGIYERLAPDSSELATSLNNLGNVAWSRGETDAADNYYVRSLAIRERRGPDSLEVAASLNNLGNVAWARGDLVAAEASYSRSLSIRERLAPDSLGVSSSLSNLGNVASDRGDAAAAENYFSRSLAIRERLAPGSVVVAASLNNLGHVAFTRGDLARAEEYHTRSLGLYQRLAPDSLNVAISLNNLGDVAHGRGDPAAQDYYSRALALKERVAPESLTVATTLNNLGRVAAGRGERSASRNYHSRALAIRERLAPESLTVAASRSELGRLALAEGRASDALPLFSGAVELIENQRWQVRSAEARALLLAKHAESYTGLLRTHMALGDVPSAFATAERARARSLLEIVTESGAGIRGGVDGTLLQRERLLQRQLNAAASRQSQVLGSPHTDEQAAAAKKELDALLVQYRQVLAEIRLTSPRYADLTQPQPLGVSEVQQQLLDDDTILLEYALGEEAGYLFVLTPGSIRSVQLPGRDEIERAARRVYDLLTARQPVPGETALERRARIEKADAAYPAAAAALSRMVLGPVAGQLSARRLLIVADGALQYVPFAALPVPDRGIASEAVPLIVHHEIVSLPSASVVAVLRRELEARPPAENLVAVVADPVFSEDDPRVNRALRAQRAAAAPAPLPAAVQRAVRNAGLVDDRGALSRLPFTRDEAAAIVALSPAGRSTRVIDFDANRATVTGAALSRHRVVHLATHGVLDTEHPELSGLVLSLVDEKGAPQDGFLRLHEVYNLNWSADLVVLSACQTALGAEIRGEGLVGLTRGFMYAGAARVLASLWSINDGATAQFMTEFYEGLLVDDLSPAAALRAAQIEMLERGQWRSPYYWAAFVLQGEWQRER